MLGLGRNLGWAKVGCLNQFPHPKSLKNLKSLKLENIDFHLSQTGKLITSIKKTYRIR